MTPAARKGRGNDFWHGTISCGLAVAPGFIPGAFWAPPPTAAGHKARRYNRLRSPEEIVTPRGKGAVGRIAHRADALWSAVGADTHRAQLVSDRLTI